MATLRQGLSALKAYLRPSVMIPETSEYCLLSYLMRVLIAIFLPRSDPFEGFPAVVTLPDVKQEDSKKGKDRCVAARL